MVLKTRVCEPVGLVALPLLAICNRLFVLNVPVQPLAAPRFVGWEPSVALVVVPDGPVQVPDAVVHNKISSDLIAVPVVGTVKLKV